MIKKYFSSIITIIFFLIFSLIFGGEYFNFHQKKISILKENQKSESEILNFELSKIKQLEDTKILYTPENNVLDEIIQKINSAQQHVYIEVYMLTEKRINEALKDAKKRGLDIKVILEKNPYKAFNINNKTGLFLQENNIDLVWSNPDNYSLNHTKMLLIDDLAIVSTGNLTHSTFFFNRDIFIFSEDKQLYKSLEKIFISDYHGIREKIYNDNLILSPEYSREKIQKLIEDAQKELLIYFPYFQDKELEKVILEKSKQGISIHIIVDKEAFHSNKESLQILYNSGINISYLKGNKMHSKAILVDRKYLFIGSINFSTFSFDKNREIGILFINEEIIQTFLQLFNHEKLVNFSSI